MQYYTSIEQSKRLIKLGLNPETADMMHIGTCPFMKEFDNERIEYVSVGNKKKKGHWNIPCWSLGALFDLLPKRINNQQLDIRINDYYQLGYGCYISKGWSIWVNTPQRKTLFEAVYDMVIWLLENHYI